MKRVVVLDIQRALIAKGYELPVYGPDGKWGDETRLAIMAFQERFWPGGATGEPDRVTLAHLFDEVRDPPKLVWGQSLVVGFAENQLRRMPMFAALEGKKTYIAVAVAALTIIVNHFFGPLPGIALDPDQWLAQLGALVFPVTIRGAIPDKNKVENGGTK